MTDLVSVLEGYSILLGWKFSYGNKSNNNLLRSNNIGSDYYLLLDPVKRSKIKDSYGGVSAIEFTGEFLLVKKSNLDNVYYKQKDINLNGKYSKNISPMLTELELLESQLDCSDYTIETWDIIDIINALDVNMDGVVVTYKITLKNE